MVKTTSPLIFLSLALFASICHQTFSFESQIPTRQEQCQALGRPGTCDWEDIHGVIKDMSCRNLRCARQLGTDGSTGKPIYLPIFVGSVKPGTRCGPNSFCLNGECHHSEEEAKQIRYTGEETKIAGCN